MPSFAVKREFCHRLFRLGGSTAASRQVFLDGLSDAALTAYQGGKTLVGTASGGTSVNYLAFAEWRADDVIELVNLGRTWAEEANLAAALALIQGPIRSYQADFSGLRV